VFSIFGISLLCAIPGKGVLPWYCVVVATGVVFLVVP
jgi:hypothetical protein